MQPVALRWTKVEPTLRPISTPRGLLRTPSNETTMVASKFASTLEVTDLRYDLAWYGAFLKDIPRRLGSNDALDASVSALTVAHSSLHTRQKSPEIFVKYGKALKALRTCLNDPIKARTVETLCAIYLIIICQVSRTLNECKTNQD